MADASEARKLAGQLAMLGHTCTFPWFDLDDVGEAWDDAKRARVAELEIDGVRKAEAVVMLLPGGRGAHAELGAALALNKRVVMLGSAKFCLFYHHANITWLESAWTVNEVAKALVPIRVLR